MNSLTRRIINRVEWQVTTKEGKLTETAKWSFWVIRRYLYYALSALLNGYPIHIRREGTIRLTIEKDRDLNEEEKKRLFRSQRHFGYLFGYEFSGEGWHEEFTFYPCLKWRNKLQKAIDSDVIYDLTRI